MNKIDTVAILGAGVIGASWSALFLATGFKVRIYDPADSDGIKLRACIVGFLRSRKSLESQPD